MDDTDERNALGRLVRWVLKSAKAANQGPLTIKDIATALRRQQPNRVFAATDIFSALAYSLHGWVGSKGGKWWLL